MAEFVPSFKLYQSDGSSLIYTFNCVVDVTGDHGDPAFFTEHTGVRGQGSVIIQGSDAPRDLTLTFILTDTNYTNLTTKIQSVKTTIAKFAKYVLKIDKDASTTINYNVMRLVSIQTPLGARNKRRTFQRVIVTFRVDAW